MKPKNEPKPKFKFSPEMQLRFGWNPVTDWTPAVTAWAQATHIDVDGNAVPAVRLATHAGRLAPTTKEFTVFLNSDPGSLLLKDGDALQFTIRPEDKARLAAPLSIRLQAVDKGDGKLSAPAEAIQKQPDGSLRVNWAIHSAGKFKIDDVKQIVLYIPREVSEGHERVLFYLTDLEIKRN